MGLGVGQAILEVVRAGMAVEGEWSEAAGSVRGMVALLDGVPVVAFDLDEEQWKALKDARRVDPGRVAFRDGEVAVPRSGKSVCRHFAHLPGHEGTTEPETRYHIEAKRTVRDVAVSRGWAAEIEAVGPQCAWRADVLLHGPEGTNAAGLYLAFEVQWSRQTVEDYVARTGRYAADGVEVVWLSRFASRTWWDIAGAVPSRQNGRRSRSLQAAGRADTDGGDEACRQCVEDLVPAVAFGLDSAHDRSSPISGLREFDIRGPDD
jgi:hypothetical protein